MLTLVLTFGCEIQQGTNDSVPVAAAKAELSEGVLLVRDVESTSKVVLRNEDGSEWNVLDLKGDGGSSGILLWRYVPSENIVEMRVLQASDDRYEVLVNEETRLSKYIRRPDSNLVYMSWEEYLMHEVLVELPSKSVLRERPSDESPAIESGGAFQVIELQGNWAKVVPFDEIGLTNAASGWIKWRTQNDDLLIRLLQG